MTGLDPKVPVLDQLLENNRKTLMHNVNDPAWAIRVTCMGDSAMLPGEHVVVYHSKGKIWNATFLQMSDNNLPHLYDNKEEAKLEAKILQKQLDFLAEQMKSTMMNIPDAAFFVRVVNWDINEFFKHKKEREEMSKPQNKRQRALKRQKFKESLNPEKKKTFRKARKDLLIDDF